MKSYHEMAEQVKQRSAAILSQKKKQKMIIIRCLAVVLVCSTLIGSATWIGLSRKDKSEVTTLEKPNTTTPKPTEDPPDEPSYAGYSKLTYFTNAEQAADALLGIPYHAIGQTGSSFGGTSPEGDPLFYFGFNFHDVAVVAKAVERYPGTYQSLEPYGKQPFCSYCLYRMEVLNPLESGLEGEFFYLLPEHLAVDLQRYDALLLAMTNRAYDYVLRHEGQLTAFDQIFVAPYHDPERGNVIAFTDGTFDETLWQEESWSTGYYYGKQILDREYADPWVLEDPEWTKSLEEGILVSRGCTLEDALAVREALYEKYEWSKPKPVERKKYQTEAAQAAMAYMKPFVNGVFVPVRVSQDYKAYRYIDGCITNEWINIDRKTEEVTTSEHRFTPEDFINLPSISAYIANLDLSTVQPLHTDPTGKELLYQFADGWYYKTQTDIYAVVRISWLYQEIRDSGTHSTCYRTYDETFLILDATGDRLVSREELISLIGKHDKISETAYGQEYVYHEVSPD